MDSLLIITTGGTIDKVYFDASSDYEVGESVIGRLLAQAHVRQDFEVVNLLRKDSLEMTDADRELIRATVLARPENRVVITHGTDTMTTTAAALEGIAGKTIVQVSRGLSHTLALTSEGKVYAWGNNTVGQLGTNSQFGDFAPVAVFTDTGPTALNGKFVIAIATTRNTSYALCSDGTIAAWGENQRGQLGNGTTGGGTSSADVRVPVAVTTSGVLSGKTVVALAGGTNHVLALCSDGTVASWGTGGAGQLGDNSTSDRSLPVLVNTTSGPSHAQQSRTPVRPGL